MVSFVVYDLILMSLFILFVIVFLHRNKKNVKRQGLMFLYHTQFGVQFIDRFAKRYAKILRPTRYLVLISGYTLMAIIIWMMIQTTKVYLTTSIASVIRAPPVAPLIPYFPQLFGLESFFPPLYFTYFMVALTIVILSHEAAHGIFARLENFRVHSTGFAFLGPIPGAFVEPDEKQMQKAKKFPQLSVLGAGTFANVIMTLIFGVILLAFFAAVFVPAGVVFNTYAVSVVDVNDIVSTVESPYEGFLQTEIDGKIYFVRENSLEIASEGSGLLYVVDDSPFFREQIPVGSAITSIDGQDIKNQEELADILSSKNPGEVVKMQIAVLNAGQGTVSEVKEYDVELGEREGRAFLGVGFIPPTNDGVFGKFYDATIAKVKEPFTHYTSKIGGFGWFVYYLLWWVVMINIAVALFNMLPLGILDGGRFFLLSVWGLTGSEKAGRIALRIATWFLLLILAAMMFKWAAVFF